MLLSAQPLHPVFLNHDVFVMKQKGDFTACTEPTLSVFEVGNVVNDILENELTMHFESSHM